MIKFKHKLKANINLTIIPTLLVSLSLVLMSGCSLNGINSDSTWQQYRPSGKITKRHEAGLVAIYDRIYLLGGRGIKPVDELNIHAEHWRSLSPSPIEIHHFQPVEFDNKIYVIGALTGQFPNEKPIDHVLIYDPRSNEWTQGATIPENRRRGAAGVSVYNNKIYITAGITDGHNGGTVNWFDEYDPATDTWTVLEDAPYVRDHFQTAVHKNKLYAVGGRRTSFRTGELFELVEKHVDVYDFEDKTWSTLEAQLPTGRAGHSVAVFKNNLIVTGGESGANIKAHAQMEILNLNNEEWMIGPSLIQGRHGTGLVVVNEKLYTASGCANRGGSPELSSTEVFEL
ncbi:Kelch repeat-containing protein [Algibacillus agarilyticus]|uniref:Kelch repeat-containing protein n=1 Tax=Algibacillus agarilyticus TaxID=2234133 RepID=UPI0018E51749|nr:kelch repeat-containing protein [Algibacillus agarilyticus]